MHKKDSEEVSTALKGPKGSTIQLKVERNGTQLTIPITRDEIKLPDVPYSGMLNDKVGYIKSSAVYTLVNIFDRIYMTGDNMEIARKAHSGNTYWIGYVSEIVH